jgi:tetratricopeptide (TPR) repeat protein
LEEALALSQEIDNKQRQLHVLADIGQLLCDQGNYDEAEPLLKRSLGLAQETGEQSQVGAVLAILGRIAFYKGEHALAREHFCEALANHRQAHEHGADMADILEWLALLETAQASSGGNPEGYRRAALLLGATEARREAMGAPVPSVKKQSYADAVEALHAHLGEDSFKSAWAEGRAMTIEEAVDHALGQRR